MGWKSRSDRIYEERVVVDSLARLVSRVDVPGLPFSRDELLNLARRFREAFYGSETRKARLARYQAHLSKTHGTEVVEVVSAALVEINNEIGWEEK